MGAVSKMKILFLHGWGATPGGIKPTFLRNTGYDVLNPPLPDDNFEAAIRIAQAHFDQHRPQSWSGLAAGERAQ